MKRCSTLRTDQVLLVKAALWPVGDALICWQQWKVHQRIDEAALLQEDDLLPKVFDPLDYESQALLSQVYYNLRHTNDALLLRFRGYYQHTWLKAESNWLAFKRLVAAFAAQGIDCLCLQGSATRLTCPDQTAGRRLQDAAFSVPFRWQSAVQSTLQKLHFQAVNQFDPNTLQLFKDAQKSMVIFQGNIIPYTIHPDSGQFWQQAGRVFLQEGLYALVLSPSHQVFCNLLWAYWQKANPQLRLIADCVTIARQHRINWTEVVRLGAIHGHEYAILTGLHNLITHFEIALTAEEASLFRNSRIPESQHRYHQLLSRAAGPLRPGPAFQRAVLEYIAYGRNNRYVLGIRLLKRMLYGGLKRLKRTVSADRTTVYGPMSNSLKNDLSAK